MDGMAFPLENVQAWSIIKVVTVASSGWIWMGLALITLLTLWGLIGVQGFSVAFTWWGKHAQVRVMLQSFSSVPSSCVSKCSTTAKKSSTASALDNTMISGNMWKDDLHFPTFGGESLNERGMYNRKPKKRSKSCSTIDILAFGNSAEAIDNCIEVGSARFLHTSMMLTFEKPPSLSVAKYLPPCESPLRLKSSLSVAKSLPPSESPLRFTEKELESPISDQKMDCSPRSLVRFPKHEQVCKTDEFERNEDSSIEAPMHEGKGKITFSSDCIYDMECMANCKGSLFVANDGEGGRQLGSCLFDNCVDLDQWRRVESFEIQLGWDKVQSLRLGYDWNWDCYTGRFGLTSDKYSKYLVRDIDFANVLDSPRRSLVKLLSLQENVVSSVEIALNVGLSSTHTVSENSTVRLWDIEVGKCFNKMVVNDSAIVGSHIECNSGFLLSSVMTKQETSSLFVWDPRDFLNPLKFSVGNMLTFHSVQFSDCNSFCVSDCFNDKLFDLRMIGVSPVEVIRPAKLSSSSMEKGTAMSIKNTNCLEDLIFFSRDDGEDEDDYEFYESGDPGDVDSEKSCRSSLIDKFVGAMPGLCTLISWF